MAYIQGQAPCGTDAAAWEEIYQNDDAGWDLGQPSPPLLAFLSEGILPQGKRVLVPGCGTGHELPVLAAAGYTVIGVDLAPSAVSTAEQRLADAGLTGTVYEADVLDTDCQLEVDWIFDQTFFCALRPDQHSQYCEAIDRVLITGGELWTVNMRTKFTNRQPYDCAPETYITMLEQAGFTHTETRSLDAESYQRRRGRETLLRFQK